MHAMLQDLAHSCWQRMDCPEACCLPCMVSVIDLPIESGTLLTPWRLERGPASSPATRLRLLCGLGPPAPTGAPALLGDAAAAAAAAAAPLSSMGSGCAAPVPGSGSADSDPAFADSGSLAGSEALLVAEACSSSSSGLPTMLMIRSEVCAEPSCCAVAAFIKSCLSGGSGGASMLLPCAKKGASTDTPGFSKAYIKWHFVRGWNIAESRAKLTSACHSSQNL